MIDIGDSNDQDILEVLQHELKEDNRSRYTKQEATQILKEYYVFNQEKTKKSMNGDRTHPSNLLEKFIGEHEQKGGNRVTLPLSFFNGEIPDKIVVPAHVDNYCAF
jgi:flagellar motor switch protein FliG